MSMLYQACSQAISAGRRRDPSPETYVVRTFQLSTTCDRCFTEELTLHFFDRVLDNPVATAGHQGKVEQAMFGSSFLGPSYTGGEQCGS